MLADCLPPFTDPVPTDGYRWWYFDGISDCGEYGIVVIAFIGSVFSPYYYFARHRGRGDPYAYCAINVALYAPRNGAWAMTERGRSSLEVGSDFMRVGRSSVHASGEAVDIRIDERAAPLPRRVRGHVRITAGVPSKRRFALDSEGHHDWQPVAPLADIEVSFDQPGFDWRGHAYVDSNGGRRPLESDFRRWDWCRFRRGDKACIHYSAEELGGAHRALSLEYSADGSLDEVTLPEAVLLPRSGWRVDRSVPASGSARVLRTLEDAPFYARSLLELETNGERSLAMHESLSLERFDKTWVRMLLPFRMPRIAGR